MNRERQRKLEARTRRIASLANLSSPAVKKVATPIVEKVVASIEKKTKEEIKNAREKYVQKVKNIVLKKGISYREAEAFLRNRKLDVVQQEIKKNGLHTSSQGERTEEKI